MKTTKKFNLKGLGIEMSGQKNPPNTTLQQPEGKRGQHQKSPDDLRDLAREHSRNTIGVFVLGFALCVGPMFGVYQFSTSRTSIEQSLGLIEDIQAPAEDRAKVQRERLTNELLPNLNAANRLRDESTKLTDLDVKMDELRESLSKDNLQSTIFNPRMAFQNSPIIQAYFQPNGDIYVSLFSVEILVNQNQLRSEPVFLFSYEEIKYPEGKAPPENRLSPLVSNAQIRSAVIYADSDAQKRAREILMNYVVSAKKIIKDRQSVIKEEIARYENNMDRVFKEFSPNLAADLILVAAKLVFLAMLYSLVIAGLKMIKTQITSMNEAVKIRNQYYIFRGIGLDAQAASAAFIKLAEMSAEKEEKDREMHKTILDKFLGLFSRG